MYQRQDEEEAKAYEDEPRRDVEEALEFEDDDVVAESVEGSEGSEGSNEIEE